MAEEEENGNEKKKDKKGLIKYLIMAGILLVFLGIEVLMAVWAVDQLKPEDEALKALQEEQARQAEEEARKTEMGATLEKPIEITVNIAETNGERFLRTAVQLEWDATDVLLKTEIENRLPKIKNIIIDILSSRPMAELITVDGKKSVRDAIVADVNSSLPATVDDQSIGKVRRAFFVEFIVQ